LFIKSRDYFYECSQFVISLIRVSGVESSEVESTKKGNRVNLEHSMLLYGGDGQYWFYRNLISTIGVRCKILNCGCGCGCVIAEIALKYSTM
jgi:hypothetical protein